MRRHREAGFSLVELICVLTLLAILASIAVPNISRLIARASMDNCDASMTQLVKDMRFDCSVGRFSDIDAVDTLLREKLCHAADGALQFTQETTPDGSQRVSCVTNTICPNGGSTTISWQLKGLSAAHAVRLTVEYSCTCLLSETPDNFTLLVALKQPLTVAEQ